MDADRTRAGQVNSELRYEKIYLLCGAAVYLAVDSEYSVYRHVDG